MESVAFYSYKGGVGRSLLLVNAARFLALSGRRVVALDLDFEAPGLHYKTGVDAKVKTGAVHLLQRSLGGDLPSLDEVREATVDVPMPATHGGWLRLLAAGPAPKAEYWADLGRLHERLSGNQDAGLLEAMLDLQVRIEEAWDPDVLLVDARTGVTGLGGIATMALCDRVVLVTTRIEESLDGTLAVADSLRATPTLRGGERRLEFVVSRVQGTEMIGREDLRERLGEYFELPHDRYDGGAERLLWDGSAPPDGSFMASDWSRFAGSLLAETLTWTARSFPTHADVAHRARNRLVAVEDTWRELTHPSRGSSGRLARERWFWTPDMLAKDVEFLGAGESKRTADIVARLDTDELAMIVEYLDEEPGPEVACWWSKHVQPRVIVLEWPGDDPMSTSKRVFSGKGIARDPRPHGEELHEFPSPVEFDLLADPTDRSIDAMLEAASRTRFYDEHLIVEWTRSSAGSLDRNTVTSAQAQKILDALASLDDTERVQQVAWKCVDYSHTHHRYRWPEAPNEDLERLILEGLCAPLCWRAPPRSFVGLGRRQPFGPTPVFYALRRLADFMGLDYDPHAARRRAATSTDGATADAQEFHFEWSSDPLPRTPTPAHLTSGNEPRSSTPGYHGHLGSYTPSTGRILLAGPTIESVANALGRAPRYIGSVTLLHLCVLGLLHDGIDLDGRRWESFSLGGLSPEALALVQFFVHRFLVGLDDERMKDAFEALSAAQSPEHRAWQNMTHISLEDGRARMMTIRHGTDAPSPSG